MKNFKLQVCVDSVESAIAAQEAGAHQLYLCSNLMFGGTTPPTSLIELVKSYVSIPVFVLLRPRLGDFIYSEFEFEQLKRDIVICKHHFVDGLIVGALTKEGALNLSQLARLSELAKPLPLLLNRCFDLCTDPFDALESAVELNFSGILSSGLSASAQEGTTLLKSLNLATQDRLQLFATGGITASSICSLIAETHIHAFTLSAKKLRLSPAIYHNPLVQLSMIPFDETRTYTSSYDELLRIATLLKTL